MDYRERLTVPGSWWLVGLFFSVSFITAVGFYAGPWVAVVAGMLCAAGVAGALLWYGRLTIAVDADGLHAGAALLEWPYLGEVRGLSASETAERLGAGADHAAYLVTRGYLRGAVEIGVRDPADPHPYWVVSSRTPARLADAIESLRLPQ